MSSTDAPAVTEASPIMSEGDAGSVTEVAKIVPRASRPVVKDSTPPDTLSNHIGGMAQESTAVDMKLNNIMDIIVNKMSELSMIQMNEMNAIAKKIENLDNKVDAIDEKLNKLYNGQDKMFKTKGKTPLLQRHKVGRNQSPQTTSCLVYNLHPAASKVGKIKIEFCDRLMKKISSENKQLQEDLNGPSVFFASNASRIQSDLQRDLKSVKITGPTLLIIVTPMRTPEKTSPRMMADYLGDFPLETRNCHYLFVDFNATAMHDCDVNTDTVNAVARFIAENQFQTQM